MSNYVKNQIERYHQSALMYGTEEQWQNALAKARNEHPNEIVKNLTYAMNPGIFGRLFITPDIVLEFARMSEYVRLGGDPTYFTQGNGGGACVIQ